MSKIQGSSRAEEMLSSTSACAHLSPASSGTRFMALLTISSLTVCCTSNNGGGEIDRVPAHRVDVRIPPMATEHTQEDGANHVVGTTAPIAGVAQRAMFLELFPTPTCFRKLEEENELAIASPRHVFIPFGVKSPARSGDLKEGCWQAHPQSERINLKT